MRIVIDMQGAQAVASRGRGIGRYTTSLVRAIIRNGGGHEVVLAANGAFVDAVRELRAAFEPLVGKHNIAVWKGVPGVAARSGSHWRQEAAEIAREGFISSLRPDAVLVTSLFEGFSDDAVVSIGRLGAVPTATVLYDLIPLIFREDYLTDDVLKQWYSDRLATLKQADLVLGISQSTCHDAARLADIPLSRLENISAGAELAAEPTAFADSRPQDLLAGLGLDRPFVLYTGGIDPRKNVEGLIEAFAALPEGIRRQHQLAIVCAVTERDRRRLLALATRQGLGAGQLVLTGYVPDKHLTALYKTCRLFVFPSLYEGFGLPLLEAMQVGAPAISSSTSSLPEIIDDPEAMFDPRSTREMAQTIHRGLSDDVFRERLTAAGRERAALFSWDETARRAVSALERLASQPKQEPIEPQPKARPRLAYVSPLPPARTGIADYSADLLPALARHYEIELVDVVGETSDPRLNASFPIRSPEWFAEHRDRFDRVVYSVGNSDFHHHMIGLIAEVPGVVVLHDFYLSNLLAHMQLHRADFEVWTRALYHSHGYAACKASQDRETAGEAVWVFPSNLAVLQDAVGVISHSQHARQMVDQWYGPQAALDWSVIPLVRTPAEPAARAAARRELGLPDDAFVLCSFGMVSATKLHDRILAAWRQSTLSKNPRARLVFVGENQVNDFGYEFGRQIAKTANASLTGWVDADRYKRFLAAADAAVQLRAMSRGETSAAVLDCLNFGLPTIVNANGSMSELPADAVLRLEDKFSDSQLIEALDRLHDDPGLRQRLGERGRSLVRQQHAPESVAKRYRDAIEKAYGEISAASIAAAVGSLDGPAEDADLKLLAGAIAASIPPNPRMRTLFVDVSELVRRDAGSGIQRVVRNILRTLLVRPPKGWRVEPVYATERQGYRYARRFVCGFLDVSMQSVPDEYVEFAAGDVFLGLDYQPTIVPEHRGLFAELRALGVEIWFVVYDLLCLQMPQHFVDGAAANFAKWLEVVAEADGALCISQSVANDLGDWLAEHHRQASPRIGWFHLGSDLDGITARPKPRRPGGRGTLRFLMVGTIESRKGHRQVLDAFEVLWRDGFTAELVLVGRPGWLVDDLITRIRRHPELGRRLHWHEDLADAALEDMYRSADCLVAASEGEGFGLPLIEAAHARLAILARDLPVFREVAGDHASYFSATSAADLAAAIRCWMDLYRRGEHPKSDELPWITWQESTDRLVDTVLGTREVQQFPPPA